MTTLSILHTIQAPKLPKVKHILTVFWRKCSSKAPWLLMFLLICDTPCCVQAWAELTSLSRVTQHRYLHTEEANRQTKHHLYLQSSCVSRSAGYTVSKRGFSNIVRKVNGLDVTMESCKNTQRRPHELPCNLVDSLKRTKDRGKLGKQRRLRGNRRV